jgi:hypothetical protein
LKELALNKIRFFLFLFLLITVISCHA